MSSELYDTWMGTWEEALAVWSKFTKLTPPRLLNTQHAEEKEGLSGSFAMIRLNDHAVVISLRQVEELGLEEFALQVLAHEIGHHVYAPGDLSDAGRILARMRPGLPGVEHLAPMVSNIYTDLLINDRLHRAAGLDMASVYIALKSHESNDLFWAFYMRTYELLWSLPKGTLAPKRLIQKVEGDAGLAARLIRIYSRQWLGGAGRFAALCFRYLKDRTPEFVWMDAMMAGVGSEIPEGLVEVDPDEWEGAIHPAFDPEISGVPGVEAGVGSKTNRGGQKNLYRTPSDYINLLRSLGVDVNAEELVARFYREQALPHLIKFPTKETGRMSDPLPEGLDVWDIGSPVSQIDWVASLTQNPFVIPGLTTLERAYGESVGQESERVAVDLYLGIDCSGSMGNPSFSLSFPVLAGAVMAMSALRARASVMVCLSGEPGSYSETPGFLRDEKAVLSKLTSYLGTGYAFGLNRLRETFMGADAKESYNAHVLIISDYDMFAMVRDLEDGWDIAARIPKVCQGATMVLQIDPNALQHYGDPITQFEALGWGMHFVRSYDELVEFARAFSRITWDKKA